MGFWNIENPRAAEMRAEAILRKKREEENALLQKARTNTEAEKSAKISRISATIDDYISQAEKDDKLLSPTICRMLSHFPNYRQSAIELASLWEKNNRNIIDAKKLNEARAKLSTYYREADIKRVETEILPRIKKITDEFISFGKKVSSLPLNKMIDKASYGKVTPYYLNFIHDMRRTDADNYISRCSNALQQLSLNDIFSIDMERVLHCIWFYALEKNYSATDFHRAATLFYRIYPTRHVEIFIAELYAKMQVGGEDALREPVRVLLKDNIENDVVYLTTLASGLMWMKAYQSEETVLQYMLSNGLPMTPKMQERLHALSSNGGKVPSGHDVSSTEKAFYFDVSALAWKDEEYTGLFNNLAFQDKTLTYALAVRDEDKELLVALGIRMPSFAALAEKFNAVFAEEYGPGVKAQVRQCIALSGSGEEPMEGVLVTSEECPQLGVMIHMGKIGKKLIIKFYTLFIPSGTDLAAQKQQALSMYKKLSPIIAMWESGLKDTMLLAVQQLLNSADQTSSGAAADTTMF